MAEDAADKSISLIKNTRNELHVLKREEPHAIYKAKADIEDVIKLVPD